MNGHHRTKTLKELQPGDIIRVQVLFAENTRDYYNGYTPEEIRGGKYTDRFGQSGKNRMVIFLGRDGKSMCFLPLTTKNGSLYDLAHQYELKDNSMTEKSSPDKRSFVEIGNIRMLKVSYQTDLYYVGHTTQEDMENIYHRVSNLTLQYNGNRDQRGYVPDSMVPVFEQELYNTGYQKSQETPYKTTYTKEEQKQTVTRTKTGMVHYHKELSREEVHSQVIHREQHRDYRTRIRRTERRAQAWKENAQTKLKPSEHRPEPTLTESLQELEQKEEVSNAASY